MSRQDNKYPNLIPNSDRTPEQLREMGRKGGIKSGESRRRIRDLRKCAKVWLQAFDDLQKQGFTMDEIIEVTNQLYTSEHFRHLKK